MKKILRVLPKFPGNKSRYQDQLQGWLNAFENHLGNVPDTVYDYYAGAGCLGLAALDYWNTTQLLTYETDPTVLSIWNFVKDLPKDYDHPYICSPTASSSNISVDYTEYEKFDFKRLTDDLYEGAKTNGADSLLLRRLIYGGVVRLNKAGYLNVNIATDAKLWLYKQNCERVMSGYANGKYSLAPLPDHDLLDRVTMNPTAGYTYISRGSIGLVDPPYYWDEGSMTPAYPYHNPRDAGLLDISIDQFLRHACGVYFNYDSQALRGRFEDRGVTLPYNLSLKPLTALPKSDKESKKREIAIVKIGDRFFDFWG